MEKETIIGIAVGIGLAASCGFRVFVPILASFVILAVVFIILKFGGKLFRRQKN